MGRNRRPVVLPPKNPRRGDPSAQPWRLSQSPRLSGMANTAMVLRQVRGVPARRSGDETVIGQRTRRALDRERFFAMDPGLF